MANHKSSIKRARQTVIRTVRRRGLSTEVRSSVRAFREAVTAGESEAMKTKLIEATRLLRRAGSKGLFHKGTVSRRVGRLVQAYNKATASA